MLRLNRSEAAGIGLHQAQHDRQPDVRSPRPRVEGKFLYHGERKLWVRGATYGTFRPDQAGQEFREPQVVERDFRQIAANGLNAIRTYSVPPRWLLDSARRHGLRVMVGLPWEQHITFLDDAMRARAIEARVRAGVRECAGHPAILGYVIGNEIPAPIVRWHGRERVERYLYQLYRAAKAEDPGGLVTYVNYPSTEYLHLPFLDLYCFNVYLESRERLEAYLARLQNLAGDRPLILSEIGLDSLRHGELTQARGLDWQIRTAFAAGCAGAFVFAWTDEWHRGGDDVEDWAFGLTRRDRRPKPALAAVRQAMSNVPFPQDLRWPRISVVVCSYNGARTIADCLDGLLKLEYPNFEVIVVNDGSTDATAAIARKYGARLISTPNHGLSHARNVGLHAATGEIVAYLDDDARPDPHWLTYIAAFRNTEHAAVGGPNIAPPGDGPIAECVANAPGGPVHVLISDREADHIVGCNMAFRKSCLEAIGGFDPQFRAAGDDVDVCWRLQRQGWTLGFSPAATVWHHRRNSVRAYWRQQVGYGRAEALLERKWPEKYNAAGHIQWSGRLYGKGLTPALGVGRGRVYHGTWGTAPFQSLYQPGPSTLGSLPQMPEWYLVILGLAGLCGLGVSWRPLLFALPLLGLAVGVLIVTAGWSAAQASFMGAPRPRAARLKSWGLTALLHLLQPLARLSGRLQYGLTPWRRRARRAHACPWPRTSTVWSEHWRSAAEWLQHVEADLRGRAVVALRGGDYDRWELEVRGGSLGAARTRMAIEEHGRGKQLLRFRCWPRCSPGWLALIVVLAALAAGAAVDQAWTASAVLGTVATTLSVRMVQECAGTMADLLRTITAVGRGEA